MDQESSRAFFRNRNRKSFHDLGKKANRCINTAHSLWLHDPAMLLFRLQGAENKDHCPFNSPVARLAASATLCFVVSDENNHGV